MINMKRKHNPHNYWTYERCKEEALKYQTKNDFKKYSSAAYDKCIKQKWYQELTSHMTKFRNPPNYWTYERCKEEALKYNDRMLFQKESSACMDKCIKSDWYKELTSHMKNGRKCNDYWTYERCKEEALKYKTKKEFEKNSASCYVKCYKNGWMDEFTSHMKSFGNSHKRCIYVYEFENNYAYVGLTYNLEIRIMRRISENSDVVMKFIDVNKLKPNIKQLTEYVDVEEAKRLERFYVEEYKNNGWNILNIKPTGSLGSPNSKRTYEFCKNESLKYPNITQFRKNNIKIVNTIYRNKWYDLLEPLKVKEILTFKNCVDLAKNCKNRSEFYKKHSTIVKKVLKNGWKDQLFKEVNL